MPENPTTVLGVGFDGRVSTAAGGAEPGEADGTGPEVRSRFSFTAFTASYDAEQLFVAETTFGDALTEYGFLPSTMHTVRQRCPSSLRHRSVVLTIGYIMSPVKNMQSPSRFSLSASFGNPLTYHPWIH